MIIIPDEKLKEIPIKDNGERLVHINDSCPKVIVRPGMYIKKEGEKIARMAGLVREGVAERLNIAQNLLPKHHRLMIRCGYRPLSLQKKRYSWMYEKLKKQNPNWSEERLKDETSKCVAPIDIVPPHSTGGAVDLTIIGPDRRLLDMGARLGYFNDKTYTDSPVISLIAKKNRGLLIKVLSKAGFVNYPTEWWHWSYGDRYWAAALKKKFSIYDGK